PDGRAADFSDLEPDGSPDVDAVTRLQHLKQRIREHLPDNVHDFHARWTGSGITYDHIPQLCEEVYRSLTQVIEQQSTRDRKVFPADRALANSEVFGEERRRHFQGREAMRQAIIHYLADSDPHPLIVYGASGVGKTALMAQV